MQHKVIDSSLKSILSVTLPMILAVMSSNLMYTIDKFMLAGYSIDSMNAVIISCNFVCILTLMFAGIADTAEIFVGQYNGSKQYEKLATPVWQMIYMSLFAAILYIPIAYFSDYINMLPDYYRKEGVQYQKILFYFSMLPQIKIAFAAFFIGQGNTKIVTFAVAIGAIFHIILNYFLIYKVEMGVCGAAVSTVLSEFAQIVILASVFFNKKNRRNYKTLENRGFKKDLFLSSVKIGAPMSIGNGITMIAWYVIQIAISHVSKDASTVYNIGINIYVLFMFVGEGMNKAVATICSNMIGRGELRSIEKVRKVFVIISIIFGLVVAIPLVFFPQCFFSMLDTFPDKISGLYSQIKVVCCLTSVDVTLEALLLSTWGILIAGGDTRYAMSVYQTCLWIFVVLPTIALYYTGTLTYSPTISAFIIVWLAVTQVFIYRRYKSLKWYNKLV